MNTSSPSNSQTTQLKVLIGFVVVCLVWGSTWLAIKIGLNSVPPFLSLGLRFAVAVSIILPVVKIRNIGIPFTPEAKRLYLNLVVFSFTMPFALIYWGEQHMSSGLASILFTTYPFWVAIFSQFLLPGEPLNAFKVTGIVLGFIGSIIIFAGDMAALDRHSMIAMGAVAVCPCMQAYSLVITPIISVLLGVIVLGEKFSMSVLIGAALVLVGVLVANGKYVYGRMSAVFE